DAPDARDPGSRRTTSAGNTRGTRLPRTSGRPRTSRFPRGITGQVDRELVAAVRARDRGFRASFLIDATVQILKKCKIGREEILDHIRIDLGQAPEPRHGSREQQHGEVCRVLAHSKIALRHDLVTRGREAHCALAMDGAAVVAVTTRKDELELRLEMR